MRAQFKTLALNTSLLFAVTVAQAQSLEQGGLFQLVPSTPLNLTTPGYDNLGTAVAAGYSEPSANNPIFGDSINLSQSGMLTTFGCSLFNSTSGGNTGAMLTGNMTVKFYNNTVPYAGGAITGALLGSATLFWDFTSDGGLPAGFFSTGDFDLTSLNINLTQNILVTQQYTQLTGSSTRSGLVLFGDSPVGSSPNNVYLKSAATAEGLYSFGGAAANSQFGYAIGVEAVPEPASICLLGLGLGALMVSRSRNGHAA